MTSPRTRPPAGIAAVVLLLSLPICLSAQAAPTYEVHRHRGPAPAVDGRLDDDIWQESRWGGGFRTPQGAAPSHATTFALRYDNRFLYLGLRLTDSEPAAITRTPGHRDDTNGDRIATFFDTNLDRESSYVFVINAAGVVRDQYGSDGEGWDNAWDGEWEGRMQIDGDGWTAELRIPLAAMDVDSPAGQEWGFQLTRVVERLEEMNFWSQPRPGGFTDAFGRIRFLP